MVADDNYATLTPYTDAQFGGYGFACDPSGVYLMTVYGSGHRAKSPDGGASWSALSSLIVTTSYRFAYAGGAGVESRWIAAFSYVWYSSDFGDTWEDRQGNLPLINPLYAIDLVWVIEY